MSSGVVSLVGDESSSQKVKILRDGKTPCEHCGKFNHKSEDCRIAKNKLQKEVKPTGLTSLKG